MKEARQGPKYAPEDSETLNKILLKSTFKPMRHRIGSVLKV